MDWLWDKVGELRKAGVVVLQLERNESNVNPIERQLRKEMYRLDQLRRDFPDRLIHQIRYKTKVYIVLKVINDQ